MKQFKIKGEMTFMEMIIEMSEGNPGAMTFLMEYLAPDAPPTRLLSVLYLDSLGIYGERLYKLWNDCCDRNNELVDKTLSRFKKGEFSEEEIFKNLDQIRADPF